jgi:hypothetical protein
MQYERFPGSTNPGVTRRDDSIIGEVEAPYPNPMSVMREMIADGAGMATAMHDAQQRPIERS